MYVAYRVESDNDIRNCKQLQDDKLSCLLTLSEVNGSNINTSYRNVCNMSRVKMMEGKERVNRFYVN